MLAIRPNDEFRSQLVDNAKAAIYKIDSLGFIDKSRVAIGGHSYGAFMVANLLSHSTYCRWVLAMALTTGR